MGLKSTLPMTDPRSSNASSTPIARTTVGMNSQSAIPTTNTQKSKHSKSSGLFHHDRQKGIPSKHASTAPTTIASQPPLRPGIPTRMNSVQTRYMNMLLALDTIPRLHNIYASFFTWILLAGYVLFPGTFTSIGKLEDDGQFENNAVARRFLNAFKNTPLLIVAAVCCGVGALGMIWLWYRHRQNYVWLLNRIFLPGCLNSLTGLISTLINVCTQQGSNWSITAKVTAAVTGSCMVILGILFVIYNYWVLKRVKAGHHRDMEAAHRGETLLEKVERKTMEPALEPGSVV